MRGQNIRPLGRYVAPLALALFSAACKKREASGELGEENGMDELGAMMSMLPTVMAIAIAPLFVIFGYWFLVFWDRRDDRPSKDDKQLGTKQVGSSHVVL